VRDFSNALITHDRREKASVTYVGVSHLAKKYLLVSTSGQTATSVSTLVENAKISARGWGVMRRVAKNRRKCGLLLSKGRRSETDGKPNE
jgi:hypothetical protein